MDTALVANATKLDVALQGGGAHGAFTWGVLERLLEEPSIDIGALSGASAGAMNAVVLASGLATGGREGARLALRHFWTSINRSARRSNPMFSVLEAFPGLIATSTSMWDAVSGGRVSIAHSPSHGIPVQQILRDLLTEIVDFDALRAPKAPQIFISATNARTGVARIFRNADVTTEALLASACLPMVFPAIRIDDEDYWDGGYSANPPLSPLIEDSGHRDLMLVTVNQIRHKNVPITASAIPDRITELTFNQSLLKELRSISMLKAEVGNDPDRCDGPLVRAIAQLRFHEIHNEEDMADLDPVTKMFPSWDLLTKLHGIGRDTASRWCDSHLDHLGHRGTAELEARFD